MGWLLAWTAFARGVVTVAGSNCLLALLICFLAHRTCHARSVLPACRYRDADWVDEDDEWLTASDDDSSPSYSAPSRAAKRARRASAGASRDASPGPLLPPSASDPLLSLLSVLDSMDSQAAAVASAAEEATQTAEAAADAAHAAYTAYGVHA